MINRSIKLLSTCVFFIGVALIALWLTNRSRNEHDIVSDAGDCYPTYSADFDASDFNGVFTQRVYVLDAKGKPKPEMDEKANADAAVDVFKRFREIPLTIPADCVDERYRLTWVPTFKAPAVIRIWRSGDRYFAVSKRLSGKGGYGLGDLETEIHHSLTAEEWRGFETSLEQASFWKLDSLTTEPIPNDGAAWIFEGSSGGNYHFVNRITPSDDLQRLFGGLFDMAGVETDYKP